MATADLFLRIVEHITKKTRYYGFYPYRVVEQVGDRLSLQAVGSVEGLPDQLLLDKAHGFAGVKEVCAPASLVLVGFQGGSPGAPFIAFFLPSTPVSVTIDAQTEIRLGDAVGSVIRSGDTVSISGPNPVTGTITFTPGPPGPLTPSKVKA
jgi:hypothetical protein